MDLATSPGIGGKELAFSGPEGESFFVRLNGDDCGDEDLVGDGGRGDPDLAR